MCRIFLMVLAVFAAVECASLKKNKYKPYQEVLEKTIRKPVLSVTNIQLSELIVPLKRKDTNGKTEELLVKLLSAKDFKHAVVIDNAQAQDLSSGIASVADSPNEEAEHETDVSSENGLHDGEDVQDADQVVEENDVEDAAQVVEEDNVEEAAQVVEEDNVEDAAQVVEEDDPKVTIFSSIKATSDRLIQLLREEFKKFAHTSKPRTRSDDEGIDNPLMSLLKEEFKKYVKKTDQENGQLRRNGDEEIEVVPDVKANSDRLTELLREEFQKFVKATHQENEDGTDVSSENDSAAVERRTDDEGDEDTSFEYPDDTNYDTTEKE